MTTTSLLIFAIAGLFAGILAGFLGIGGGTVLVPLLVALKYTPVQAVGTSSLAILITAISGSAQNWRMGLFSFKRVIAIGFPAVVTAQIGAYLATQFRPYLLLTAFGLLLLLNIYLVELRKQLTIKKKQEEELQIQGSHESTIPRNSNIFFNPNFARIATGSAAGILAGLFGVGGGVIMVPLQILLLGETIKVAIQTSLGVIVITAISATIGHAFRGNVLLVEGLLLGCGGFLGAQISTRFLPKLPDEVVSLAFRTLLGILSIYVFWQAWQNYNNFNN
ncbi:sulfite exporter TauE/SafE family protein [Coleofasciculus sp. FACHB-1120]|uniref:sulfite exporter TauE/SafE family protein n=1 Tax=Coleofasciculus sp. FACHB-1120 TaxID=2692783 RepID=UPI001682E60C|nr:sulfite exporter TauE/SafE family protein [Coleofasciculus sp. FACHB-1120]MBD2744544.1 sulfite exporter TauE/SafE family protein [Coleofasciculus sp. FACHB-1120]